MRSVSLRFNVVANYASQVWTTLMGLAFVPVYIRYLGIDMYGLLGVFVLLQAILPLLDLGLTPALSREMARFRAGAISIGSIRDLLRSIELVVGGIALLLSVLLWCLSGLLATSWLQVGDIPVSTVTRATQVMALTISLRFFETVYRGSLSGLQHQVLLSVIQAVVATVRGIGAICVLKWISPDIFSFVWWQAAISGASILALAVALYSVLPYSETSGRFCASSIKTIRKFASGMIGISAMSITLTQLDKIILSKMIALDQYGYYILAANIASTLYATATPIGQAFYPRFSELLAARQDRELVSAYHTAAQLMAALVGSVAGILIARGDLLLTIWTHDVHLADQVSPILAVLSLGILINCLTWVPHQMQLAHGVVGFALKANAIMVVCAVPCLLWAIANYGPIGAAWSWVLLNSAYVLLTPHFVPQPLIRKERWRWYVQDTAIPLLSVGLMAYVCQELPSIGAGWGRQLAELLITASLIAGSAVLGTTAIRTRVIQLIMRP